MAYEFNTKAGCQEYFGKTHDMVRKSVREFVKKEVLPYIDEWEEQGGFPVELFKKAGDVGILGIGYPEAYGGTPGDIFLQDCCLRRASAQRVRGVCSLPRLSRYCRSPDFEFGHRKAETTVCHAGAGR